MGCQRAIAQRVIEKEAGYVLALKGNQGTLYEEVDGFFRWAQRRQFVDIPHTTSVMVAKAHGRLEERRYWLVSDIAWLEPTARWPGLLSIGLVEATRTVGGTTSVEHRYYVTSLAGETA